MPKPAKTSIRSSRENRVNAIEDALTAAHGHAVMHCGTTLYGMPEYFMCTRVAEHFANEFSNFQYRLEASVEQVIGSLDLLNAKVLLGHSETRSAGRFDVVLFTRKRGRAAHIIEFKIGDKLKELKKDINRIARLSDSVGTKARLQTNYLVFITKQHPNRDETRWQRRLDEIVDSSVIAGNTLNRDITCKVKKIWKSSTTPSRWLLMSDSSRKISDQFSAVIVEIRAQDGSD